MFERILANVSRHIQLTPEEVNYFTSIIKSRTVRKRQYLLQAGDVNRFEIFVNAGCLRSYEVDDKGQEHIVQFAPEDWWTGDMYSFLTGEPATKNIDALEDTEVLLIEKSHLEELYVQVPKFDRFYRLLLQRAYTTLERRISENLTLSAEERYNRFIERYPNLEQRLTQRQIASYLGITPESLSRIRRMKTGK
jgi:CRP-like cAMP-binding protein